MSVGIRRSILPATAILAVVAVLAIAQSEASRPSYAADGKLLRPTGFRSWVAAGSSLGLTYREGASRSGHGPLSTVYLEPSAFAAYRATGEFPEGTMLALAVHESAEPDPAASIGQGGVFAGRLIALEVAVKDSSHFDDGWAYFDFGVGERARASAEPFAKERCFSCHVEHAAKDNVFVQFYPVLRDAPDDRAVEAVR